MKKLLLSLMAILACATSHADVLAELTFAASNDKSVSSYTAEWTATNDYGTWNIMGFNNNNNGWAYIKCGRKGAESTASIETPAIGAEVTDVTYTVDKTSNVKSATLLVIKDGETVDTKTVEWGAGEVSVSLTGVESGCSFKLVLENESATANGPTQISKIVVNGSNGSDPVAVESVALTDAEGNAVSQYTTLTVSESMQLKAVVNPSDATNKKVTWEVMQNDEVISLVNGKVTALKAGQAAVVVTTEDGDFQAFTTFYVSDPQDGTIAEFIEAEGKTCYLTGVVSEIVNATYGNFTLTDESGSIYVYGCLNADGESKKFAELGISEGDKIKVLASEYKMYTPKEGDPYPEAVNVVFVENFGPVGPAAEYTFQIEDHGTTFTVTPSDEEVMYYVELLPAEHDAETVAAYFDSIFEEMGEGLEYFQGVQAQSYEDDWCCEVGEEGKIWVCAVSADYKRVSELFSKEFTVTDTPTGIVNVKTGEGKAVLFNLAGQKVGANAKGLIISGGKVVLK